MKKIIYLTATILSLYASPALAQSMQVDESFDGLTIGLESGLLKNNIKVAAPGNVDFDVDYTGLALRAYAGYDIHMSDSFVVGGELGLGRGIKHTDKAGTASFSVDQGLMLDASLRAGLLLSPNWLVYGRAGYSTSNLDISVANTAANSPAPRRAIDESTSGLLLGGGVELALNESMRMRLEYRRADYGDFETSQAVLAAAIRF